MLGESVSFNWLSDIVVIRVSMGYLLFNLVMLLLGTHC